MTTISKTFSRAVLLNLAATLLATQAGAAAPQKSYIVEARDAAAAVRAVRLVGGRVTHELPIINGASAELSASQAARLSKNTQLQIFADAQVATQDSAIS